MRPSTFFYFCNCQTSVSALDKNIARKLLFEAVDDVDEAIKLAEEYVGKDYKILLMPEGSLTVPVLKK